MDSAAKMAVLSGALEAPRVQSARGKSKRSTAAKGSRQRTIDELSSLGVLLSPEPHLGLSLRKDWPAKLQKASRVTMGPVKGPVAVAQAKLQANRHGM